MFRSAAGERPRTGMYTVLALSVWLRRRLLAHGWGRRPFQGRVVSQPTTGQAQPVADETLPARAQPGLTADQPDPTVAERR